MNEPRPTSTLSALEMIRACFRHQHPEDFGRAMVDEGPIPAELRYGTDHVQPSGGVFHEAGMGDDGPIPAELRYGTHHVPPSGRVFAEESMGDPDALTA